MARMCAFYWACKAAAWRILNSNPARRPRPLPIARLKRSGFFSPATAKCGGDRRRQNDREEIVAVESGVCLTIPLGTHFQFRALGDEPLAAIAVTMPPWPGGDEAYPVEGTWR